jgi:hypothetical protein
VVVVSSVGEVVVMRWKKRCFGGEKKEIYVGRCGRIEAVGKSCVDAEYETASRGFEA